MVDTRLPASGNIQVRVHPANAFANPARPTPAEVNAGLNITDAVSWNDFDFGLQASTTNNDPSLASKSNVADRGSMQYGGSLSIYLPADFEDDTNLNKLAWDILSQPRTVVWVTIQIDGELSENNTPTYPGGLTQTAANGDLIQVYKVMTGGYTPNITGETAFRETISLLSQGDGFPNAVVSTTAPTLVVTPATLASAPDDIDVLNATVNGREFTRGVRWKTSDSSVATVSQNGVVTSVAAGTATITATYAGVTDTVAVTVS